MFCRVRVHRPHPRDEYVPDAMLASGVDGLPVEHIIHGLGVSRLDDHLSDLFDRVLVSQAMLDDLSTISANPSIAVHEVEFIDATR